MKLQKTNRVILFLFSVFALCGFFQKVEARRPQAHLVARKDHKKKRGKNRGNHFSQFSRSHKAIQGNRAFKKKRGRRGRRQSQSIKAESSHQGEEETKIASAFSLARREITQHVPCHVKKGKRFDQKGKRVKEDLASHSFDPKQGVSTHAERGKRYEKASLSFPIESALLSLNFEVPLALNFSPKLMHTHFNMSPEDLIGKRWSHTHFISLFVDYNGGKGFDIDVKCLNSPSRRLFFMRDDRKAKIPFSLVLEDGRKVRKEGQMVDSFLLLGGNPLIGYEKKLGLEIDGRGFKKLLSGHYTAKLHFTLIEKE